MSYVSPQVLNAWAGQLAALASELSAASASMLSLVSAIDVSNADLNLPGYTPGDLTVWSETPVFMETFPVLAPSGAFPSAYAKAWYVYPTGWLDSSGKGRYNTDNLSVIDRPDGFRVMRQVVAQAANGTFGGCVACPQWADAVGYLSSYRLSYRRKLEQQDNGHDVVLGWPAVNGDWPAKSGEPDHTEYNTPSNPTLTGWLHVKGATSGSDHQVHLVSSVPAYDDFHVITVENIAGVSYRRYIDGVLSNVVLTAGQTPTAADSACPNLTVLAPGYSVPDEALRFCFQLESNGTAPVAQTVVDTDWVTIQPLAS